MRTSKSFVESLNKKAESLIRAYKNIENEDASNSFEAKLLSYNEHINSFFEKDASTYENHRKRNEILYNVYHKMGDILVGKNKKRPAKEYDASDYKNAVAYYTSALKKCVESGHKLDTCKKLAEVYKKLGDHASWLDINYGMVDYLENHQKREAYAALTKHAKDDAEVAEILEKALEFVYHEQVSSKQKTKNTIQICRALADIYEQKGDAENLARIRDILEKAKQAPK